MCGIENIRMATKTTVTNTQRVRLCFFVRMVAIKTSPKTQYICLWIGYIGHKTKLIFHFNRRHTFDGIEQLCRVSGTCDLVRLFLCCFRNDFHSFIYIDPPNQTHTGQTYVSSVAFIFILFHSINGEEPIWERKMFLCWCATAWE